jgi:hypothetical protein
MMEIASSVIPSLSVLSVGSLNTRPGGTNQAKLRVGAADNIQLAAEWTPTESVAHVKEIWLLLEKLGTVTSGKVVSLRIESDSSGLPSGTSLGASANVQTDSISSTFAQWIKFNFTNHVQLLRNTVYHVVLTGDYDVSSSNCIVWISSTVASGGNQEIKDASWAKVATENFNVQAKLYNLNALGFAEPILYNSTEIPAVFENAAQITEVTGIQYENAAAIVTCRTSDVSGASESSTVSVQGTNYNVIEVQHEGDGTTRLILSVHAAVS